MSDGEQGLSFSPDGSRLAFGAGNNVLVWELDKDKIQAQALSGHSNSARGTAFSPDGRCFATCGCDRNIIVWDAHSYERIHTLVGAEGELSYVAFSPDGRSLASCGFKEGLYIWHVATGLQLCQLSTESCKDFAFTPDGTALISLSNDGRVSIFATGVPKPAGASNVEN